MKPAPLFLAGSFVANVVLVGSMVWQPAVEYRGAIGSYGFVAYKTYGGQWMQNLVPRPPSPASKD